MIPSAELEIRKLSMCTFSQAVKVWNDGFEDYFFDMNVSLENYLRRLYTQELSPSFSFIAFVKGVPAGFVLNGIRIINEKKVAWNGGTGVIPQFRGKGIGKALIKESINLYRQQKVDTALLEVVSQNERAFSLYEEFGYRVIDSLYLLRCKEKLSPDSFKISEKKPYRVRRVSPYFVGQLPFYNNTAAWQAHWQSVFLSGGEGLIVADALGKAAGYALFKKAYDGKGKISEIILYQLEVPSERADTETIVAAILKSVYSPLRAGCLRTAHNLSKSNYLVRELLIDCGFNVLAKQYHMAKFLNKID